MAHGGFPILGAVHPHISRSEYSWADKLEVSDWPTEQELCGGELDSVQGRALEILSQSGLPSFFVLSVSILLAVLLQFLPSDCYVGCERS